MTNIFPTAYYKDLDVADRHIRVLHLAPGSPGDPIVCELSVVSLDNAPYFEALSYAWGAPNNTRAITLQGHDFQVTVNLFNALRRLRYENKVRPLWVDALCINQSDDVEKSRQVGMMGEIYTKTNRALLWLGDFDEKSSVCKLADSGPDTAVLIVSANTSSSKLPPNTIDRETGDAAFDLLQAISRNKHVVDHAEPELSKKRLLALGKLHELSWWQRMWTVQETILPAWCTFVCGDRRMDLEQVLVALHRTARHIVQGCCNEYDDHKDGLKEFFNEISTIASLLEKAPDVHRLMVAFNSFKSRQVTNPRDRVYALAGLGPGLSVDYTLSADQVLRSSFRQLMSDSKQLDSMVRANEVNRSPSLPTWIPDLTAKCRRQDTSWIGIYELFNAHNDVQACLRDAPSPFADEIELTGFQIDRIVAVGRPYFVSNDPPVVEWQDKMDRQCSKFGQDYPLGGTYESAFRRTVIGGAVTDLSTGGHRRATSDDDIKIERTWRESYVGERLMWLDTVFFVTRNGFIGLGSLDTEARDCVFVLDGGRMPFVLRGEGSLSGGPSFDEGWFSYIGHAYVHGIMDGEASKGDWVRNWVQIK